MEKRSLECFIALAEELHFHRAAERCHISQPGLSQQLRRLEEQLQVQLVSRSKRHVALTRAGAAFLDEARRILNSMSRAVDLARQTDHGLIGQLTVGATASALFILLPELIKRFSELLPQVHVEIRNITTAEQEVALREGEIHVGVCHPPLIDSQLACDLLAELPFDVVVSSSNPLSRKARLSLKDLAEETFVLFPREVGPRLYDQIISLCHQQGFSPRRIVEIAPAQSIVAMAACNVGVGFVASKVQHYDRGHAVFRRLSGIAPQLTLGAAYQDIQQPPMVRSFLEAAVEIGSLVE